MKLFFYSLFIALAITACQNNSQKSNDSQLLNEAETQKVKVTKEEIFEKVKARSISSKYTVEQAIKELAGEDGMVDWSLFIPEEYSGSDDIVGVRINFDRPILGGKISFRMRYLYQVSTKKVSYYFGTINNEKAQEYEFTNAISQMQLLF